MPPTDQWNTCFGPDQTEIRAGQTDQQLTNLFCRVCRNTECTRSMIRNHGWQQRISTQVDRLLVNPKFGSADQYGPEIRELNFPSMFREAMRIEIADRKQDWSVPTDQEINSVVDSAVQKTGTAQPVAEKLVQSPAQTIQVSTTTTPEYQIEVQSGTAGAPYQVKLTGGVWTCTCKAFSVGPKRGTPCKHIQFGQTQYSEPPDTETRTDPAIDLEPVAIQGKVFYPSQPNAGPQRPIMVDGTRPVPPAEQNRTPTVQTRPAPQKQHGGFQAAPPVARPKLAIADDWSVPVAPVSKKPDNIVPVGGRVVMGKKP